MDKNITQNYKERKKIKKKLEKCSEKNYEKNYEKKKIYIPCPCGGGQSCIVSRREVGDWVHEDQVFKSHGLGLRENCYQPLSESQKQAMKPYFR